MTTIPAPGEITRLLAAVGDGDRDAEKALIPMVYGELRKIATSYMRRERSDHTLQTTALVHEAYLKLIPQRSTWQNRAQFYGVAAQQMRRILLDYARKQRASKRGGASVKVALAEAFQMARDEPDNLIAVHGALEKLGEAYPRQAQVVELRFFGGCTEEQAARALSVSPETVKRDWKFAKAWLSVELKGEARS